MNYWKLNEDRRIVAVSDIIIRGIKIKEGQVGGVIPEGVQLPNMDLPLWVEDGVIFVDSEIQTVYVTKLGSCYIDKNCKIGYGAEIADYVIIEPDCEIGRMVTIAKTSTIHNNVIIRDNTDIGSYVKIGAHTRIFSFVSIGHQATIQNRVTIHNGVNIGIRVRIGSNTQIHDSSNIGEDTSIANDVQIWTRVTIGTDFHIGECSLIESNVKIYGHCNIVSHSHIAVGNYFQFIGCGDKARTLTIYRKHDGETVISVGCQCGINLREFKERVRKSHGTTRYSAQKYQEMMPMFERAYAMVSRESLFMIKLKNLFR